MTTIIQSGYTGTTYPMTHPRIGWNSTAKRGSATVSTAATGYPAANALDPLTYSFWRPTALPATFEISTADAETISYCGIAGHDLGTAGATVEFQVWEGGSWVAKGSVTPTTDAAIMFLCSPVSTTKARISISGSTIPTIAVVAFGAALELPDRAYQGYTPIDLASVTEFTTNMTEGGQFAGRSVKRRGRKNTFTLTLLSEAWIRATGAAFFEEALERPFFLSERPGDYPDAVDYMWTEGDVTPTRSGPKTYMTVQL